MLCFFFFMDSATTGIYTYVHTLPLHDALPISPNEPIRRCILSGEREERGRLIRLALSPDGLVLPDAAARAPGRGAWLAPDRAALENAISKHKLKGALSRAFKTGDIGWPDEIGRAHV